MAEFNEGESIFPEEIVDREKELEAHEFRNQKRANSPDIRAALTVIRADPDIWDKVEPAPGEQRELEGEIVLPGELHRVGASLFSNIYTEPEAAALYDIALCRATQDESRFFKEKIEQGVNFVPVTIVGAGGVYGTIFSAAFLKEAPDNPPFGFDASPRRGGIWTAAGDLVLDKPWWRMNSRNRPENRSKAPLPGTDGNLNSLGAEAQNLQLPDISSAQYPTNNEFGRILAHDNFLAGNIVTDARLVKVRPNRESGQRGQFEEEYEDAKTGKRFFVYTDTIVQASGLGQEDLGFSRLFSSTREVLDEVERDLKEGTKTPRVLTFLQLVEATTSNRELGEEFESFGLVGKGDTSKVVREHFAGIGGIDPGVPAQLGFLKQLAIYGIKEETAEELAKSERARYFLQLVEFQRERGGFFRFRPVAGRVVGLGIPKDGEGIVVYYRREDETPEGKVVTYGSEIIPRLVTAAGFEDMSDMIYTGLTAQTIEGSQRIAPRIEDVVKTPGSTIYYARGEFARVDITASTGNGRIVEVVLVDRKGNTQRKLVDRENLGPEDIFIFNPDFISKVELAGRAPKFEALIDREFDDVIPVAEKAQGFEIYKVGACTDLPLTDKERRLTAAYFNIPENTKSVFRFVRRTVEFARKLAKATKIVPGSLNLEIYKERIVNLPDIKSTETRDLVTFPVDGKANAQKLPRTLKSETLLQYLALAGLSATFPENFNQISFGVRRQASETGESPFNFAVQFDTPIPDGGGWEIFDSFLKDQLMQRLLVQLTRQSSGACEITISLKNRQVDIKNTTYRTIRNREISNFEEKYKKLKS